MGWELRHGGRWYLYRNRRVNGKPVKEYLGCRDPFGFGTVAAEGLEVILQGEARVREHTREQRSRERSRINTVLTATIAANTELRAIAEGVLYALGFHKHKRGEWRMRRDLLQLSQALAELEKRSLERKPVVNYTAPANDAEAVELFAKARAGDADARNRVAVLIRERKWVSWIGDLGRQATRQLIWHVSGGDPVWEAGIVEKANALRAELLGEKPTVLEELLVRRVVNGWIATHALELELTVRPPADAKTREHLDRALSRAQKRLTEATRELARVRRLQAPTIRAQLRLVGDFDEPASGCGST